MYNLKQLTNTLVKKKRRKQKQKNRSTNVLFFFYIHNLLKLNKIIYKEIKIKIKQNLNFGTLLYNKNVI
jgi:hypothetical protein